MKIDWRKTRLLQWKPCAVFWPTRYFCFIGRFFERSNRDVIPRGTVSLWTSSKIDKFGEKKHSSDTLVASFAPHWLRHWLIRRAWGVRYVCFVPSVVCVEFNSPDTHCCAGSFELFPLNFSCSCEQYTKSPVQASACVGYSSLSNRHFTFPLKLLHNNCINSHCTVQFIASLVSSTSFRYLQRVSIACYLMQPPSTSPSV